MNAVANSSFALISVINVLVAQTGLLEIALLMWLLHPVDLFVRVLGSFEPPVADV